MTLPVVTNEQRMEARRYWREHEEKLRKHGGVSEKDLQLLAMMTQPNCIGYDSVKGEVVRPGEVGRWDLLEILKQCQECDLDVCMRLAGISDAELAQAELEEDIRHMGFDPMNPDDVKNYDRLRKATPGEIDAEIKRLENQLGLSHI